MADTPDPIMNRRNFFRVGLRRLLQRAAEVAAPLERVAEKLADLDSPGERKSAPKPDTTVRMDQRFID